MHPRTPSGAQCSHDITGALTPRALAVTIMASSEDRALPTTTPAPRGPHAIRSTTVLCVRDDKHVALAGDGQVTVGSSVMKRGARKIRRLHEGQVLAGFAGSAADAFALFGRFEDKLSEYRGSLPRAAIELAK